MNIIAAVDNNWAIGNKNELLVRIPNDQKFFREETMGKVIVLGHRTLLTFPQGMPLQGRKNIILSRDTKLQVKNGLVVHSLKELGEELKQYDSEDIYIAGGESIYQQLLPYCDTAHITKIDRSYEADRYFPNLDRMSEWQITQDSEEQTYFDLEYVFLKYESHKKQRSGKPGLTWGLQCRKAVCGKFTKILEMKNSRKFNIFFILLALILNEC